MKKGVVVMPNDLEGAGWLERLRELHLDTLGVHSGGGPNHDVMKGLGETASASFRQGCRDAGLACEYELHAARAFLDPALFGDHPDYFAWDRKAGARTTSSNSCVSSPEALELISQGAERLARALPSSTHCYYFWGADTSQGACACPRCASYSPAEQNLLRMNAVARGVRRADPAGMAASIVYLGCYELPAKVEPEENIFFEFAPFIRCYDHSIGDPSCDRNKPFAKSFRDYLARYGAKRMKVLEYWIDSSLFSDYRKPAVVPPVSREIMRRDMDFYCSAGIRDITTFAVYMGRDYFAEHGDGKLRDYAAVVNEFLPDREGANP